MNFQNFTNNIASKAMKTREELKKKCLVATEGRELLSGLCRFDRTGPDRLRQVRSIFLALLFLAFISFAGGLRPPTAPCFLF